MARNVVRKTRTTPSVQAHAAEPQARCVVSSATPATESTPPSVAPTATDAFNAAKECKLLRWMGSKLTLDFAKRYADMVPESARRRLIIPFAGSLSDTLMLTSLHSFGQVIVCDANRDLINLYRMAIEQTEALIEAATKLLVKKNTSQEAYLTLREKFNRCYTPLQRAALFLFLNQAGFNGKSSYNRQGLFNTSWGKRKALNLAENKLRTLVERIKGFDIVPGSYEALMVMAGEGDFIYCDPPYVAGSEGVKPFVEYTAQGFDMSEQQRLARLVKVASGRGATVVISNNDTPVSRELYAEATRIETIEVERKAGVQVSKKPTKVGELLAHFHPMSVVSELPLVKSPSAVSVVKQPAANDERQPVEASQQAKAFTVIASAGEKNFSAADGTLLAAICWGQQDGQWRSAYSLTGLGLSVPGRSEPLTTLSAAFSTLEHALADAAKRLDNELNRIETMATRKNVKVCIAKLRSSLAEYIEDCLHPKHLKGWRHLDLFSGHGGFAVAMQQQGASTVAYCEIDPAARETLAANFDMQQARMFDDIRVITERDLSGLDIDLITMSSRCQDLSRAGSGAGLAGEKSALFFEAMRVVGICQPKVVLVENVAQLLTHDAGASIHQAHASLTGMGYSVSHCVRNAGDFGLAQQRERMWMVALRADVANDERFAFPEGEDASKVMADILELSSALPTIPAGKAVLTGTEPAMPQARPVQLGTIGKRSMQGYRLYSTQGKSITLCAASGGPGRNTGLYATAEGIRRLTVRECLRLQGMPEQFKPHARSSEAYKQAGNALAVPVAAAIAKAIGQQVWKKAA